jgi:hypothetical protein
VPARRLLALGAAAAVAAFAAFGELVASGAANGLDQWANNHAMPLAGKPQAPPTLLESLVPLLHASFHPVGVAIVDVVTLPGQVVLSLLLVLTAAFTFWRCGRLEAATAWTAAWVVAVAVEFLCRHAVTRPALYRDGVHVISFDSSWPSGHVVRCAATIPSGARDLARGSRRAHRARRLPYAERRDRRAATRDGGGRRHRRPRTVRASSAVGCSSRSARAHARLMRRVAAFSTASRPVSRAR